MDCLLPSRFWSSVALSRNDAGPACSHHIYFNTKKPLKSFDIRGFELKSSEGVGELLRPSACVIPFRGSHTKPQPAYGVLWCFSSSRSFEPAVQFPPERKNPNASALGFCSEGGTVSPYLAFCKLLINNSLSLLFSAISCETAPNLPRVSRHVCAHQPWTFNFRKVATIGRFGRIFV